MTDSALPHYMRWSIERLEQVARRRRSAWELVHEDDDADLEADPAWQLTALLGVLGCVRHVVAAFERSPGAVELSSAMMWLKDLGRWRTGALPHVIRGIADNVAAAEAIDDTLRRLSSGAAGALVYTPGSPNQPEDILPVVFGDEVARWFAIELARVRGDLFRLRGTVAVLIDLQHSESERASMIETLEQLLDEPGSATPPAPSEAAWKRILDLMNEARARLTLPPPDPEPASLAIAPQTPTLLEDGEAESDERDTRLDPGIEQRRRELDERLERGLRTPAEGLEAADQTVHRRDVAHGLHDQATKRGQRAVEGGNG